jgi:S-adenosyl-L-methionine hydrolase (adenosine-forming)
MLITLTTDFGLQDGFVGIMKGVIATINPQVQVIDLTHGIPAQDILAGALTLRHAAAYFPRGTIHVAVVDPGVGSARRPLLIESDGNYFIGPDNGLLSLAVENKMPTHVVELSNPAYHLEPTSATFHGRDIFAPVAAHLSLGVAVTAFGDELETFDHLRLPKVTWASNELHGEIIYIDSFGNLFTNIQEHDLKGLSGREFAVSIGALRMPGPVRSYAAAATGDYVAVVNSWGLLEIAVYRGNARKRSGAIIGDRVKLVPIA